MALHRNRGGLWLSAYNANTTTEVRLRFPLGAPILCGMEAEMVDGRSSYHFARSEHRECRLFVEQADGVISCRETPPINARFRRNIRLTGLKDATVRLLAETGRECAFSTVDPNLSPRLCSEARTVTDAQGNTYLELEHVNGRLYALFGYEK